MFHSISAINLSANLIKWTVMSETVRKEIPSKHDWDRFWKQFETWFWTQESFGDDRQSASRMTGPLFPHGYLVQSK